MRHINTEYIVQNMNKKYHGYGYTYHSTPIGIYDVIISTKNIEVTIIHHVKSRHRVLAVNSKSGEIHGVKKKEILETPADVDLHGLLLWLNPDGANFLHENRPLVETLIYGYLMNKKYPKVSFHVSSMAEQDFDVVFAEKQKKFSEYHCAVDRLTKELYPLDAEGKILDSSNRILGSERVIREHVTHADIVGNFLYLPYYKHHDDKVELKVLPMLK